MKQTFLEPTTIYIEAEKRLETLNQILTEKEKNIAKYPNGTIHIIHRNNIPQFYLRKKTTETPGHYISKSDPELIRTFLQKSYDKKILKYIVKEISALKKLLKSCNNVETDIRLAYSAYSDEIKQFLSPIDCSDEDYAKKWLAIPYKAKEIPISPDSLFSEKGEQVRSKTELNIANALFKYNIPYKYECPLILKNGQVIHPDFTILNVSKRKIIYWEHRGMMDDRTYARHSVSRIKEYQHNGIYLGDNLIITEEISDSKLGTIEIKEIIKHYFI